MERYARGFIHASLTYLALGAAMGVLILAVPPLGTLRFAHVHINLLGWVSMMIYGVAYHVLPRFTGNPVYSRRLAWWHLGLVNAGLIGMAVFGSLGGSPYHPDWRIPLVASAAVEASGIALFIFNIAMSMRTHDPQPAPFAGPPCGRSHE
jgi:hypothetical protein